MTEYTRLRCPNCNGDLRIENGIDTFYCQYCGTKIVLKEQSNIVVEAKKEIKLAELEIEKEIAMQKRISSSGNGKERIR